jgi:hypothetical protein
MSTKYNKQNKFYAGKNRLKYLNSLVSWGKIFNSNAWEILKYVDIKRIML